MGGAKSILVVGGGVVGLCTAYYALRRGHSVTIVERGGPGRDCCSVGNAGLVVPSHFVPLAAPGMAWLGMRMLFDPESPFSIRPRLDAGLIGWLWRFWRSATPTHVARAGPLLRDLNLASRRCFEELAALPDNDFGLEKKGLLMLCRTEQTFDEEARLAGKARQLGLLAEVLTPAETARLEPGVRMNIAGAVYFPQDCHLVPARFLSGLTRLVEEGGARFRWNAEVLGWRMVGDRVAAAVTSQGEMAAGEFVVAGGSWSAALLRGLGLRLPLQVGKGYSVTLPRPSQRPAISAILTEARVAVTPMGSALRFGGTMEIAGLDDRVNAARVRGILKAIPRYFPDVRPEELEGLPVWCGLRPCSPDGLPYVGRFAGLANLSVATGHAMLGVSLGPITGRLLAEVLSDETPSLDLALLRPDRFAR